MPNPDLILVAQIGASFGLKGEFKLTSFTEQPLALLHYKPLLNSEGQPGLELKGLRRQKSALIGQALGIDDKTKSDSLKGLRLFITRSYLPELNDEDEVYISDLIGLEVRDLQDQTVGRVASVDNFGAGDLLEIKPPEGTSFYIPFTRDAVPLIDIKGGFVGIDIVYI
jgi:16S rRNA processing protein RimM